MYFLNVTIPNLSTRLSLRRIFGVGFVRAERIASFLGSHPNTNITKLKQVKLNRLSKRLQAKVKVDVLLRKKLRERIRVLRDIRCWNGLRRIAGLPVRGQRTKTNAQTARALRIRMGTRY